MHAFRSHFIWNQTGMALGLAGLILAIRFTAPAQAPVPPQTPPVPRLPVRKIPAISAEDLTAQFPLNAQGAHEMEIPQIVNTCEDKDVRTLLSGRQVETTGEIAPQPEEPTAPGRIRITRPQMQCCAAHACNYSIFAAFTDPMPELKKGGWVRVTGVMKYEPASEKFLPVLMVRSIVEIPAPLSPILK